MQVKVTIELNSKLLESFDVKLPAYEAGVLVAEIERLFISKSEAVINTTKGS